MLSKAVLSFVGRLVGIAAVLVSPLVAQAAETADVSSGKPTVARPSPSHGHRHKSSERKGKKRGTRHLDATGRSDVGVPATDAEPGKVATSGKEGKEAKEAREKRPGARGDDAEVTTERASAKTPPRPSSTPLPTLAAATTRPLVEPISTKSELTIESKGHAPEPRRTPIVRASAHTEAPAEQTPRRASDGARREKHPKPPCLHAPVSVTRGTEEETFPLTRCDGSALPQAIEEMSIMVRPGSAAKPASPVAELSAKTGKGASGKDDELAPGIRKVDERLVERLQIVLDHFGRPAATPKVFVVSGYRPTSKGSFHATGRAIDFRVDGVENTDLVAFCKTLPDTGCGFYPNSSFIHLDVRDSGSGHVSWIDASAPGEKPEYIAAWPVPPADDDAVKQLAKLDDLQLLPPPARAQAHERDCDCDPKRSEEKSEHGDQSDPALPTESAASVTRKLEDE